MHHCLFALLFLWIFFACTVVSSVASHQEGYSNIWTHPLRSSNLTSANFLTHVTERKKKEKSLWILFGLLELQCRWFFDPRRPAWEAPADLPHLPPPAACGEPPGRERRPHHPGLLQETVRPWCRAGSEDHHQSFGAGLTQVPEKTKDERFESFFHLWDLPFSHHTFVYSRLFRRRAVLWSTQSRSVQRAWRKEAPASSQNLILTPRW